MARLGEFSVNGVLRSEDSVRAKKYYTEVLGLREASVAGPTSEGIFTAGDGSSVMIYERPGMPAPENTTLGFSVPLDRFDEVSDDLRAKGVVFEDFDLPDIGLTTVKGIAEFDGVKVAWFKDSEGNTIALRSI